nr:hypothetical protein [Desulfobulbaceae bacterium]
MTKKLVYFLVVAGMMTISTNSFGAETCGTLLQRCGQCHDNERICKSLGKSEKYWKGIIKYMISNGAEISAEEGDMMVPCLSSKAEDAVKFCK